MKKAQSSPQIFPTNTNPLEILDLDKAFQKQLGKIKTYDEIKIVYFGTPEFSAYILEKLIEFCDNYNPHKQNSPRSLAKMFSIQTVITRADKPVGRKQTLTQSPVALVAQKYNIPTLKPTKLDEEFTTSYSHLSFLTCDLFIVASYGKIIPQALLDIPRLGALNVHPSLLPKYRGASPIIAPILNGDKETGVTIMLMDEQMDHGPLLSTTKISLLDQDNHQILTTKLAQASVPLLTDTLTKFIDGEVKPQPQDHSKAIFTKLIKKEDGYFDINNPPSLEIIGRMIRAYYPWPSTWTIWKYKIIKFLPNGLIQMEGKKPQSLKDFLNGYPSFPNLFAKT